MKEKEIALKCVDSQEDCVDVSFYSNGSIILYTESNRSQLRIEATKEALKEFATKILKELDNGMQRN